ncbi:MAG: transglutaminase-like cysteine peptidase [Pseudomonadota bacterium]|nr:MAG: transglutaminase [Pseudomonadota bacterium]
MGSRTSVILALAGLCLASMATVAEADTRKTASVSAARRLEVNLPDASSAIERAAARPPVGWLAFCRTNWSECTDDGKGPSVIDLDRAGWHDIVRINLDVNRSITPVTDMEHWGVEESWDLPSDGKGDCEDYVLLKRKLLIERGFPARALLITVVRDEAGDGHAVLTVRTTRGDFILDNKRDTILSWTATGYRFIKRQSQQDTMQWVALGQPDAGTVTAAAR